MRQAMVVGPKFTVGQRVYITRDLGSLRLYIGAPVVVVEVLEHAIAHPILYSYRIATLQGDTYLFTDQVMSATKPNIPSR